MNHSLKLPGNGMATSSIILCWLLLLFSPCMVAKETDRSQPIHLEADRVEINEKTGSSNYEGNVKLRQGTLEIKAEQITVFKPGQRVERFEAKGNPVHFRQEGDTQKGNIRGHANQVIYLAPKSLLKLNGDANIWQNQDKFMGEEIVYDMARKLVKAQSGPQGENRVHVIIHPHTQEGKEQE